jgi:hypothetical protein
MPNLGIYMEVGGQLQVPSALPETDNAPGGRRKDLGAVMKRNISSTAKRKLRFLGRSPS